MSKVTMGNRQKVKAEKSGTGTLKPLQPRYFFVQVASDRLMMTLPDEFPRTVSLYSIAGIHYLYGADVAYLHPGIKKPIKLKQRHLRVINHNVEPYLRLKYRGYPIQRYKHESEIAASMLSGKYDHFWPYLAWSDEGNSLKAEIKRTVLKHPRSQYFVEWKKKNDVFRKRARAWFLAYTKKNPKTQLLFWMKSTKWIQDDESFIVHMLPKGISRHPEKLTQSEITKRRAECLKEMEGYANFLVDEFCKGPSRLFPITEFEK